MPIKPENLARYPVNWKQIRERILQRARYRCEYDGCGAWHREVGYWMNGKFITLPRALHEAGYEVGHEVPCINGIERRLIKIVLTIAHLDHTPENCDESNLRAWCQRHHLAYDAEHHKRNAAAMRRARKCTADLFEVAP